MEKIVEKIKTQKILIILLSGIGIILIVTIGLAMWQYPETYELFNEHISNLGGIVSEEGHANFNSSLIMIIGFSICAAIALSMSIIYFLSKKLTYKIPKGVLALALSVGAAGIAVPLDHTTLRQFHYIGAALFILGFGTYNFVCQARRYFRKHGSWFKPKKKFSFWFDFVFSWIVLAAVVMYLVVFLLMHFTTYTNMLSGPLAQKIVLFVDLFAIIIFDRKDM